MSANDPTVRVDIVDEATWNKILEAANNPLPESEASDKGKFLHLNESTGEKEWIAILPEIPESDGEYKLVCTVDDGEATLSWESVEDESTKK